jgi:hypothetical protein
MDPGSLCLVTTVRSPGTPFESFLRYHLAIGIAQIIVFFDDPQDPAIAIAQRFGPAVTVVPADEALHRRYPTLKTYGQDGSKPEHAHTVRQMLNAEIAIGMAMEQGHQWLLHLDADELFFSPSGNVASLLQDLADHDVDMAVYANFEAVPTTLEVTDPFKEVHLFKINPGLLPTFQMRAVVERWMPEHLFYFTGYTDGKAMVRLRPGVLPIGRHRFSLLPAHNRCASYSKPLVLHYAHCGLATFTAKFAHLATEPAADTHGLWFYRKCVAAWRTGGDAALRPLYEQSVMIPPGERLLQYIGDQSVGKFYGPARILAEAEARQPAAVAP